MTDKNEMTFNHFKWCVLPPQKLLEVTFWRYYHFKWHRFHEVIGPWPKPSTNELAGWFLLAISLVNHGLGLLLLLTINVYFSVTLLQIFHTSDISKCEGKHETKKQSNSSTDLIFSNSEISLQFQEANMLPKSIHNKTDTFTWYLPYSDLWSLYTGALWCFYGQI